MVLAICYLCGEAAFKPTKDHVIPKSRVDKKSRCAFYSRPGQIRLAHWECNKMKADLFLPEFIERARKIFLRQYGTLMERTNGQ